MKVASLRRTLLLMRVLIGRASAGTLCAATLAIAAALAWSVSVLELSARIDREARALAQARSAPAARPIVPPRVLAAERLAAFYSALGDAKHSDEIVAGLFRAAADAGIALDKGEYKAGRDVAGRFDTYSIVLPVKGDYQSIRRFCEKVLLATPYAALDDIRFERASTSEMGVKANLRFTMFLRLDTPASGRIPSGEVQR